jgi:DMSO/TMAO reductase YedYZ molybdopterin-dependent catalytic subunit/thiosulfate reductase cytochrome b subunit
MDSTGAARGRPESWEDPRKNPVLYPPDRRFYFRVRPSALVVLIIVALLPLVAAWLQYLIFGLPDVPVSPRRLPEVASAPHGFPAWLRVTHYVNFFFIVLLARSGLSILADHPRLYWRAHSRPGSEWVRLTPKVIDTATARTVEGYWSARDDARYISPWLALPGFRHTVGLGRHWHFLSAMFWVANGLLFLNLLFASGQWRRLVPMSWSVLADAWAIQVHYATFHLPVEPDGFYRYNALQQLAYFGVVFVLAPLQILTGLAMSPAIDNHFKWYSRLFGNRQAARSIHFLGLLSFLGFLSVHVTMVVVTGLARNMNHIVVGTDDTGLLGLILGLTGIGVVVAACVLANRLTWRRPRLVQATSRVLVQGITGLFLDPMKPRARYTRREISPYFWPNGKLPTSDEWTRLAADGFRDYRLLVHGLVDNPVELSLDELKALGKQEQITLHHCIQGWSGIAEWGGVPIARLVELVKPLPEAARVVFHSFGEGLHSGAYYDTQSLRDALHPQSILAYEMNGEPLGLVYGAPLRLRVENQLGYKMVKWIRSVEFVASERAVGRGFGGKNEDDEYYDLVPNI